MNPESVGGGVEAERREATFGSGGGYQGSSDESVNYNKGSVVFWLGPRRDPLPPLFTYSHKSRSWPNWEEQSRFVALQGIPTEALNPYFIEKGETQWTQYSYHIKGSLRERGNLWVSADRGETLLIRQWANV